MLVSPKKMLQAAEAAHCAVGQFNINNLEWIRAILSAAEKADTPVILGVTEAAAKYMGGLRAVSAMSRALLEKTSLPVALHLDHAGEASCLEAIGAGFTSVMFDGSNLPFEENLGITRRLVKICRNSKVDLEVELGSPAGEEDGISGKGERADVEQCRIMAETGATALAASCGNIHGQYPTDWRGLDFELLAQIKKAIGSLPLALHGGSGIPPDMIKKAISLGVAKINVNTECQTAFASALKSYFAKKLDQEPKGYNPQKIFQPGIQAIEKTVLEKIKLFRGPAAASR